MGSYRTPPGWHRVHARIGDGAERGTVFRSRAATGERWRGEALEEDLSLTRVITLTGLEPGVNAGPGCDSLERYIYLPDPGEQGLAAGVIANQYDLTTGIQPTTFPTVPRRPSWPRRPNSIPVRRPRR